MDSINKNTVIPDKYKLSDLLKIEKEIIDSISITNSKIIVNNCKFIKLPIIEDGIDGILTIAENLKSIPFNMKRIYYINNLGNEYAIRGKHAHKKLEQIILCINGYFLLTLDDGKRQQEIILDEPNIGVYLGIKLWHTMTKFSKDCVLLVLSSDYYDESDYIRDYNEFLRYVNINNPQIK